MAATTPFQVVTASVSGLGLNFQPTTTSQASSLNSTNHYSPSLEIAYVANQGAATAASLGMAYIRLSSEATPTATVNDLPLTPNTVFIFSNPVPTGVLGVAVIVSVSPSLAGAIQNICITPGQGGI